MDEWQLRAYGSDYTLKREGDRWVMLVVNAAVRAWSRGFPTPRYFDDLAQVEARYKAWQGIAALVAQERQCGEAPH